MNHRHHTCSPRTAWQVSRVVIAVPALLTLFFAACSPPSTPPPEAPASATSETAGAIGDVSGLDIAGLAVLMESAKGRVTVINFWATWCVPCVAEMPELAEFYHQHSRENVAFIALSLDSPDEINTTVKKFMEEHKIPFPAYVMTERDIEAISEVVRQELYGALPVTIVYDRKGAVKKVWEGAITLDELNAVVRPLL